MIYRGWDSAELVKPDSSRIIDSIIWSLRAYVAPEIRSPFAASVMATVENLLRHVQLRVSLEPQLRWEDNADLRELLEHLLERLESHPRLASSLGGALAEARAGLAADPHDPAAFPSIDDLIARAEILRRILDTLLAALLEVRESCADDPLYLNCRREIRAYLARQLEREDRLVTAAFSGSRR